MNHRALRAPLGRFYAVRWRGWRRGVRFPPGRPTIEEVAKRVAPTAAVGAVALLEDSSESSGRATESIRAKPLQFPASAVFGV